MLHLNTCKRPFSIFSSLGLNNKDAESRGLAQDKKKQADKHINDVNSV